MKRSWVHGGVGTLRLAPGRGGHARGGGVPEYGVAKQNS